MKREFTRARVRKPSGKASGAAAPHNKTMPLTKLSSLSMIAERFNCSQQLNLSGSDIQRRLIRLVSQGTAAPIRPTFHTTETWPCRVEQLRLTDHFPASSRKMRLSRARCGAFALSMRRSEFRNVAHTFTIGPLSMTVRLSRVGPIPIELTPTPPNA